MLAPNVDVRALVPRARVLSNHSPAYELELVTADGELILVASNEGRGGSNSYSDYRVARVLEQQACSDFPDEVTALDSLCAALADGAGTYAEAVQWHREYIAAYDLEFPPDAPYTVVEAEAVEPEAVDPRVELQILASGLEAFGLAFVPEDTRCLLTLPGGDEIVAWIIDGGVAASWIDGSVEGGLDLVAAAILDRIGGAG